MDEREGRQDRQRQRDRRDHRRAPVAQEDPDDDDREDRAFQQGLHRRFIRMADRRSEEHTSELQSLMRISYAVFCLKKKNKQTYYTNHNQPCDIVSSDYIKI